MSLIYVVDADPNALRELAGLLTQEGHEVRSFVLASDLFSALRAETPALVLADLYMPGMQGVEVIIRVAKGEPAIPVIALSRRGASEALFVVHDASHLGAAATLSKPLVAEEAIQTVRRALGSHS